MPDAGLKLEICSLSLFVDAFIDPVEAVRKVEPSGENTRAASGNLAVLGSVDRKHLWGPATLMLSQADARTLWAIWEEFEFRRVTLQDPRIILSDTIALVRERGARTRALVSGTSETTYNSGANREYYAQFYAVFAAAPELIDYGQSSGVVELVSISLQEAGEKTTP